MITLFPVSQQLLVILLASISIKYVNNKTSEKIVTKRFINVKMTYNQ